MSRIVFSILLLAVLAWFKIGATAADDARSAKTITAVGDHRLFDGKLVVKVFDEGGNLTFRSTRTGRWGTGTLSPAKDVKKGAAWVIVVDSPDRFWVFWDGPSTNGSSRTPTRAPSQPVLS